MIIIIIGTVVSNLYKFVHNPNYYKTGAILGLYVYQSLKICEHPKCILTSRWD